MNNSRSRLAPVALFVFNRPSLLVNAVDTLLKNPLCADTELYVFSDGPRTTRPDDYAKVEAVRDYVRRISGFKKVHIENRETNLGVRMNVHTGIDAILRSHDRVIALEDDLLYAPNFLDYMNGALDLYKDVPKVWCVNGCSLNRKSLTIPESWPYDAYFLPRNNSYGWGIWKNRWELVDFDLKRQWRAFRASDARGKLARAGADLPAMLRDAALGRVNSWAVSLTVAITTNGGLCVTPVHSYVAAQPNAAGMHVAATDERVTHELSYTKWPLRFPEDIRMSPDIQRAFLQAYQPGWRTPRDRVLEAGSLLKWRCKAVVGALCRGVDGLIA